MFRTIVANVGAWWSRGDKHRTKSFNVLAEWGGALRNEVTPCMISEIEPQ